MDPFSPKKYYYLIRLQFLGFRYHGWQVQPGVKTVQGMVEKTIKYVLGESVKFKLLGSSRTDAMVSANDFPVELFLEQKLSETFLDDFNINLPADITAKSIVPVSDQFNVIKDVRLKEYHYCLTYGSNKQALNAHLKAYINYELERQMICESAQIYVGEHNFNAFSYPYESGINKTRTIEGFEVAESEHSKELLFKVKGKGFMRHQVRLMIGALIEIGKGMKTKGQLIQSLNRGDDSVGINKAPASGLILHKVTFE